MLWSSEFRKPNPPVTDQLVREVEALLGVVLPESYVALMREGLPLGGRRFTRDEMHER